MEPSRQRDQMLSLTISIVGFVNKKSGVSTTNPVSSYERFGSVKKTQFPQTRCETGKADMYVDNKNLPRCSPVPSPWEGIS